MRIRTIILATVLSIAATATFAQSTTVKLAIGDWAPYTSPTDKTGKLAEIIVSEAFKLEGINVSYEYYPWKRSFEMVRDGAADGTFPWNKTADREKDFFIHKEVIASDDGVYFHLKTTKFDWNTLLDLKKYRVGVTNGYKQEALYKENGIKADVAPDEVTNFKKLLSGRIDVYQTSKIVGFWTIKNNFSPAEAAQFTSHPKVVENDAYYILFSRKTATGKELADKFDSGFKK
jgi:polar amino acid transport system substrate-binding protein